VLRVITAFGLLGPKTVAHRHTYPGSCFLDDLAQTDYLAEGIVVGFCLLAHRLAGCEFMRICCEACINLVVVASTYRRKQRRGGIILVRK